MRGRVWWWGAWLIVSAGGAFVLASQLFTDQSKPFFLPGPATHGHHQIELVCTVCHGDGFDTAATLQNACLSCHGDELKMARDAHPMSKFTDPRNAALLQKIDARQCVACHVEHRPELVTHMGVTEPLDVCLHCHRDIAADRPSHQGMSFDTCQSAGCHNFHDNRALYEDFLLAHAGEPAVLSAAREIPRNNLEHYMADTQISALIEASQIEPPPDRNMATPDTWPHSLHAAAGMGCVACHGAENAWIESPRPQQCAGCHENEVSTFLQGKHGMRLAQGLSPMTPAQGRLSVHVEAAHRELTCNTCHAPHAYETERAAVDKCLGCHNDKHSNEYLRSEHYQLWRREMKGEVPVGSGVSCATCHMPRTPLDTKTGRISFVDHNQNANLRPNEKMLRPVCMDCHGLAFSIDALADPVLVEHNFTGQPAGHIQSIDMTLERNASRKADKGLY